MCAGTCAKTLHMGPQGEPKMLVFLPYVRRLVTGFLGTKETAPREGEASVNKEAAAKAGERCPQSYPHGPLQRDAVSALIKAGRIRSEVFALNWRMYSFAIPSSTDIISTLSLGKCERSCV